MKETLYQLILDQSERLLDMSDRIFDNPEYDGEEHFASGLLEDLLERITAPGFDILEPYGIIVAEHSADRRLDVPAGCRLRKTYRYGKIAVTLFCREGNE